MANRASNEVNRGDRRALTREEARARLRLAARELESPALLKDHVWLASAAALAAGVAIGASPGLRRRVLTIASALLR